MPIQLTYKVFKDHLQVEFSGKRSSGKEVKESIDLWKQITDICKKENINRILTINKVEGRSPATSVFNVVESLDLIGWTHEFKIAGVAEDDTTFTNISLIVTFMQNLGYECGIFRNVRQAKKWLFES